MLCNKQQKHDLATASYILKGQTNILLNMPMQIRRYLVYLAEKKGNTHVL